MVFYNFGDIGVKEVKEVKLHSESLKNGLKIIMNPILN